jgi:hypothetical protein
MTTLSPADLVTLRAHPHVAKFYMSIFKPVCIYTGQIAGTPTTGARYITVTDISGDITDIEEGFTLKVKDASGNLVCKRRYRSRVGQVLKIDENTVVWSTSYTIEAYRQRELWTVFPYIDAADSYRFYKDYDVNYSDQNVRIPPVAIAGATQVGFLDGASITFTLDGSNSYIMSSVATSISTYAWSCDYGTIAAPTAATTTITFTTAGQYIIKLTVTDNTGASQSTYRTFFVHERTGVNAPFVDFDLESIDCSWSNGGCTARPTLRGACDLDTIEDGAYIVIWSENWYSGVKQNIGSYGNIRFAGYIMSESIQKSIDTNEVTFELGTIDVLMRNMRMFSISLEAVGSGELAITWYQFPYETLTVARAVHHLWKWHSTLLDITDVYLPIEVTSTMAACDDMADGNLFTLVDWTYDNGIFTKLYCDQTGILYLEQDSLILDSTARNALDTYLDIITTDWRFEEGLQLDRGMDTKAAQVTASGIASIAGVFTPLIAQAPGEIPGNYGDNILSVERLVLSTQAALNTLVGRLYAIANSDISEIRLEFTGDYPIIMSQKVWYTLTVPASYTHRGYAIDVRMKCVSIVYRISTTKGTIYPQCVFEVDVDSVDGVTIVYTEPTESHYSPIPAYTPALPYVPNIPVIYPVIPVPPTPNYPNGPPTTVTPPEPTIPTIDPLCKTTLDFEANGPYYIYSGTVNAGSIIIPVDLFLRGTNFTNPTRYTLNGVYEDVNSDTGEYESTIADDFYEIYALDGAGTRIATGIHDAVVGTGYQRTGQFNAAAGVEIQAIELVLNKLTCDYDGYALQDFAGWQPPTYTSATPGIYSSVKDANTGVLQQQYANLKVYVSNPPWIWDVTGHLHLLAQYTMPKYPMWFDLYANIYPAIGVPAMEINTPWDALVYSQSGLYGVHVKIKYPSHGSVNDAFIMSFKLRYTNVHTAWMSVVTTLTPLMPKIRIDSLLLWNVCKND